MTHDELVDEVERLAERVAEHEAILRAPEPGPGLESAHLQMVARIRAREGRTP